MVWFEESNLRSCCLKLFQSKVCSPGYKVNYAHFSAINFFYVFLEKDSDFSVPTKFGNIQWNHHIIR